MNFVDIHHHGKNYDDTVSIRNFMAGKDAGPESYTGLYSIGIHPWYIHQEIDQKFLLTTFSNHKNAVAIGECGLDPHGSVALPEQEKIFLFQAELAEMNKKPLIIHCVKAYHRIILLRKQTGATVPWIIHGFNANEAVLEQCLRSGMMISVGAGIFNTRMPVSRIAGKIPLTSLFFETDESPMHVKDIYTKYSILASVPGKELVQNIYANFVATFNI